MSILIELGGMPNAGKTTLITLLQSKLQHEFHEYDVCTVSESTLTIPQINKGGYEYNRQALLKLKGQIYPLIDTHGLIVLIDRGFNDRKVMFKALTESGNLSVVEYNQLLKINSDLSQLPVSFILGLCSPKTSLSRDEYHSIDHSGTIMNPKTLNYLYSEYLKVRDKALYTFDTDVSEITEYVDDVYSRIISLTPGVRKKVRTV